MGIEKIILTKIPKTKTGHIIPIKEKPKIIQGYEGPQSHFAYEWISNNNITKYDHRFCIDFKVPLDSPIIASKEGVVTTINDSLSKYYLGIDFDKGFKLWTNMIIIKHPSNEYSAYSHIKKESSKVKKGEKVFQGQEIAQTGLSGWIGPEPHLHFMVLNKTLKNTFPVNFKN